MRAIERFADDEMGGVLTDGEVDATTAFPAMTPPRIFARR
jgi:hypothetical protein